MKKILIIEDAPNVAAALKARFEANGYETLVAGDAVQGLNLATHAQVDLILLDISVPGGNGLDLAKKFQNLPETKSTPFIFVTASKDPELRAKAMNLRAAGLLEKPYDPEELLETARFALGDTYTIHRPNRQTPPETESAAVSINRSSNPMKKILIIEDDEKIALALSIRLKSVGYETAMAHDAINGVCKAKQFCPDLALLDISMPAGNGFMVAERLRCIMPNPPPVIFLTASKQPGFLERAMELGVAGYFQKPFVTEQLVATIQKTLNQPSARL